MKVTEDRYTFLGEDEKTKDGRLTIDEIVMGNASVHFEVLSDTSIMLIMDNGKQHWHFTIFTHNGRGKIDTVMYEAYPSEQKKNKAKWCPQHGYPLPCYKCGLTEAELSGGKNGISDSER